MLQNLWFNYPGRIIAFVEACIALAIAFGLNLSGEQVAGIIAVITFGLGMFTDKVAVSRRALDELSNGSA